jgi:hypothetical protein
LIGATAKSKGKTDLSDNKHKNPSPPAWIFLVERNPRDSRGVQKALALNSPPRGGGEGFSKI